MQDFITSASNGIYTVADITTGQSATPWTAKQVQIISINGSTIYDSGPVALNVPSFVVPITNIWTTSLAITQIKVILNYFKTGDATSVDKDYYLPTIFNIEL